MGRGTSPKRKRVLYLSWHVRNGLRVEECRTMLETMGLDERGNKSVDPKAPPACEPRRK